MQATQINPDTVHLASWNSDGTFKSDRELDAAYHAVAAQLYFAKQCDTFYEVWADTTPLGYVYRSGKRWTAVSADEAMAFEDTYATRALAVADLVKAYMPEGTEPLDLEGTIHAVLDEIAAVGETVIAELAEVGQGVMADLAAAQAKANAKARTASEEILAKAAKKGMERAGKKLLKSLLK